MQWIHHFQLFLFDFDGLLVNTEELHFMAYKRMCLNRGFDLDWDFNRYCQAAHYDASRLKEHIYAHLPKLYQLESNWDILYAEKREVILQLLNEGAVHLMPGVEALIQALTASKIKSCVVTHSPDELVKAIRKKLPILNSIPHWVTREHYSHPKPNPECYQKAISLLAADSDKVIGFEDTPRGMQALIQTRAKPILLCEAKYPEIPAFLQKGVLHFTSLEKIKESALLAKK